MAVLDTLQGLLDTGLQTYKAATTPATTTAANPAANGNVNLKTSSGLADYAPWLIGAGVVLLLVLVFTARRR